MLHCLTLPAAPWSIITFYTSSPHVLPSRVLILGTAVNVTCYLIVVLLYISPVTNDVRQLFTADWPLVSFLEKCLLRAFTHFLVICFITDWVALNTHSECKSFFSYIICKYFLPFCGFFLTFLMKTVTSKLYLGNCYGLDLKCPCSFSCVWKVTASWGATLTSGFLC